MKKISWMDALVWMVWAFPIAYLIYNWPALPILVPVHFDIDGQPDKMGSKNEVAIGVLMISTLALGIYFVLKFMPKIDPKRKGKDVVSCLVKIGHAIVLLLSVISAGKIYSAVIGRFAIGNLLLPALGLFFAFMGNIMYNLKPNYFAGIRIPWTLHNEDNWKSTHRLAAKLWFTGGIILTIATLIFPAKIAFACFAIMVVIMGVVPIMHSYQFYKKNK